MDDPENQQQKKTDPPKKKILIVDDQELNLKLLEKYLEILGYDTEKARNGAEAVEAAYRTRPDLIIMDVMMPVMDGFEATRIIKEDELLSATPLIIMTSLDSTEDRVQGIEAGADDFITKPYDDLTLKARVSSLIRIGDYNRSIRNQYARIQKELDMARILQNSILPDRDLKYSGVDICHAYIPSSELGGDFYSILELDGGILAIFIADVLGHGVQASLVTMILKTLFENAAASYSDPSELMQYLNSRMYTLLGKTFQFASAALFLIDTNQHTFKYSSAAHPPSFLLREGTEELEMLKKPGFLLGINESIKLKTGEGKIGKGDLLVLYTDGLTEVTGRDSVFFGDGAFTESLLKSRNETPEAVIQNVLFDLMDFSDSIAYEDDINLIVLRYG